MTGETVIAVSAPDVRVELPGGFVANTGRGWFDPGCVRRWLPTGVYWALGQSRGFAEQAAAASVNFGVYGPDGTQVGHAWVVTDGVAFGWLCDVYVARRVRGRGLGVALSRTVAETFRQSRLKRLMLVTPDAHDLYAEMGFVSFPDPEKLMVLRSAGHWTRADPMPRDQGRGRWRRWRLLLDRCWFEWGGEGGCC